MRAFLVASVAAASLMAPAASAYSESKARAFVYLAGAAYCNASSLEAWNCGEGCTGPLTVSSVTVVGNTGMDLQAYVGKLSDGRRIVSFRGTRPSHLADWIDDIKSAFHTPWVGPGCDGCKVADGFYKSYLALAPGIKSALNGLGSASVVITGHSLGAAMAGLAIVDLHASGFAVPGPHYTFGHPRDGDAAYASSFANTFGTNTLYRVIHYKDIVPHLPLEAQGFHHSPREVWYNEAQTSYQVCDGSGEDSKCSDSLWIATSVEDHLNYLGLPISRLCT